MSALAKLLTIRASTGLLQVGMEHYVWPLPGRK